MTVVPIVLELIRPSSVVDVGCGLGEWLVAFQECGVDDIFGIDGEYVDRSILHIPQEKFKVVDINKPFILGRTYDLAVCLEVAEHLEPENASNFVASLTRLAPVILFSAAIPLQGGTHHVNEQWPEYWVHLFKESGFVPVDAIRKRIWSNPDVKVWYRQNTMLFCKAEVLAGNIVLDREFRNTSQSMLSVVHPDHYFISIKRSTPLGHIEDFARKIYNDIYKLVYRSK